jgi:hypothetical protein
LLPRLSRRLEAVCFCFLEVRLSVRPERSLALFELDVRFALPNTLEHESKTAIIKKMSALRGVKRVFELFVIDKIPR